MIWIIIVAFIAGFSVATVFWCYRFRDRAPVGCLIANYSYDEEMSNPEYYLRISQEGMNTIDKSKTVIFSVIHKRKADEIDAE